MLKIALLTIMLNKTFVKSIYGGNTTFGSFRKKDTLVTFSPPPLQPGLVAGAVVAGSREMTG
jgi:hypothetical protein